MDKTAGTIMKLEDLRRKHYGLKSENKHEISSLDPSSYDGAKSLSQNRVWYLSGAFSLIETFYWCSLWTSQQNQQRSPVQGVPIRKISPLNDFTNKSFKFHWTMVDIFRDWKGWFLTSSIFVPFPWSLKGVLSQGCPLPHCRRSCHRIYVVDDSPGCGCGG